MKKIQGLQAPHGATSFYVFVIFNEFFIVFNKNRLFWPELQRPKIKSKIFFKDKSTKEEYN